MAVTAKVRCTNKETPGGAGAGSTTVYFGPNYRSEDGPINSEWAVATPSLSIVMTVKDEDMFEQGASYTLTFYKE